MILTTNLNDTVKTKVLAKKNEYGINAFTYVNETQAKNKVSKLSELGIKSCVFNKGRIFYIKIN